MKNCVLRRHFVTRSFLLCSLVFASFPLHSEEQQKSSFALHFEKGRNSKKKDVSFSAIPELSLIPFADKEGIVLRYKRLKISGVDQAYNPSIIATRDGYILAFRNDEGVGLNRKSSLALAKLDSSFRQIGKTTILTSGKPAEDPRCILLNNQLYLLYSYVKVWDPYETVMALSPLNTRKNSLGKHIELGFHPQKVEKNWVPFVYSDVNGADLYFVYSYSPYRVLRASRAMSGAMEEPFSQTAKKIDFAWEKRWGKICGGTPALMVNDEYLSFFHSSFRSQGIKWYVIGAYTFSRIPPFQQKRISKYPILFKKMYQTPMHPHVWFRPWQEFRVVFPGGFVEATEKGSKVIHLAFGENDSGLCILTLDKEKLLSSLVSVEP